MILNILFSWIWILVIDNVKGENGCKKFDYLECVPNKTLVGQVIKSMRVLTPGLAQCQSKCFAEPEDKCISYNLGPEEGHVRTCELNRFDHMTSPAHLKPTEKTGYHYCPIRNACYSNPCQSSGKLCIPDFYRNSFKCIYGFWEAWGPWGSLCSLPRMRRRGCVNPLTQALTSSANCGEEDKQQIPPSKDCGTHESLGVRFKGSIPDDNFRASSSGTYNFFGTRYNCKPYHGRLNYYVISARGWCAGYKQQGESIWVDLDTVRTVTKISMQGRATKGQWPTQFTLAFRQTSSEQWAGYFGGPQEKSSCSGPMTFFHNVTSSSATVTSHLPSPITARYVKVIVVTYRHYPSLRFDLIGC